MTTVYVPYTVTGPDGEPIELELAAEVSADGEVEVLGRVLLRPAEDGSVGGPTLDRDPVPEWALSQIDMGDLALDVRRRLKARERGWP